MINQYLKTIEGIFKYPKDVVNTFLESDEKKYIHPFKFLILSAVPFILIASLLVDYPGVSNLGQPVESELTDQLSAWIEISAIRLSTQFLSIALFLAVPLLSLPALFFLRDELDGFYSHLILNSYAIGASMLIIIAVIPLWIYSNLPLSDPFLNSILPAFLICLTVIWVYQNYLSIQNVLGWTRIFSSFISGYLLFLMFKGLFAGIIGYMFFAINRIAEISGT